MRKNTRDNLPRCNLQLSLRRIISDSSRSHTRLPDDTFQDEKQMYTLIYVICIAEVRRAAKITSCSYWQS